MKKCLMLVTLALLILLSACGGGGKLGAAAAWQEQYDLGVRYLSEGNYEEAVIAFQAAVKIEPKRPEAYAGLADAYVELGEPEKAQEALRQGYDNTNDAGLSEKLSTLQAEDAQWKSAYAAYIQEDMLSTGKGSVLDGSAYYFFYGNDDRVPELYISYPYRYTGGRMCTVLDGVVDAVYVGDFDCEYIERENLFLDSGGGSDNYYDRIYTIQDGKFAEVVEGAYVVYQWAEDPQGDIVADYTWDGQTVDEAVYEANLETAFPSARGKNCKDGTGYTYEEILDYLQTETVSETQPTSGGYVIRRALELDGTQVDLTIDENFGMESGAYVYKIEEVETGHIIATFQMNGYDRDDIEVIYGGEGGLVFAVPANCPEIVYRYDFEEHAIHEIGIGEYQAWGNYLLNAYPAPGEAALPGVIALYALDGTHAKTLAENPCFLQYYIDGDVLYYVYSDHSYEEMMELDMSGADFFYREYHFEIWAYDQTTDQNTRINEFDARAYPAMKFQDGEVVFETDSGEKRLTF